VLGPLDAVAVKPILGTATHVVVVMPAVTRAKRRLAFDLAAATGLPVLTVPNADELRTGMSRVERLRDIEPKDLLSREPVNLDEAGISAKLAGKCVFVTGAGSSTCSELCQQVARYALARLVFYGLNECKPYTIEQELTETFPAIDLVRLIGDVKDLQQLRCVYKRWIPHGVVHAAAFKYVPLMEEHMAPALRNNTLGRTTQHWRQLKLEPSAFYSSALTRP